MVETHYVKITSRGENGFVDGIYFGTTLPANLRTNPDFIFCTLDRKVKQKHLVKGVLMTVQNNVIRFVHEASLEKIHKRNYHTKLYHRNLKETHHPLDIFTFARVHRGDNKVEENYCKRHIMLLNAFYQHENIEDEVRHLLLKREIEKSNFFIHHHNIDLWQGYDLKAHFYKIKDDGSGEIVTNMALAPEFDFFEHLHIA